jgi:DHA1 family inner membrane transport protein
VPPSLLSLMLVVFGLTTGEFVIAGILPDVAGDLAVSVPAAGRLVSAYALGMIVGGPVVTALTARLPRKPPTEVSGFAEGAVPVLLLVYGAGAVAGNFLGGRLSDRDLMPSLIRLLGALAAALALFWAAGGVRPLAAVLTFALGLLAFAVIPGMQTRVLTTAGAAPTLAVAVNASGYQVAAAFAGWLGGALISDGPGLRSLFPAAALLTLAGLASAVHIHRSDRRSAAAGAEPA